MNFTPDIILTDVLAAALAIVLLSNAAEKIVKAVKAWKAPNAKQDARLKDLEWWKKTVESKLNKDNERLEKMEDANSATIRALLALLNHGIDGNNIKQMQDAKELLQDYLINR
jgi:hypothetical protein